MTRARASSVILDKYILHVRTCYHNLLKGLTLFALLKGTFRRRNNVLQCTVYLLSLFRKFNWRWEKAGSPPHGLTKVKGSVKIAASRGFVDSVLHDPKIADLLNWTRHTKLPDETFFATINHNPSLKVPGSYTGR